MASTWFPNSDFAGGGNDLLIGGAGNDYMDGGAGNDYITDREVIGEFLIESGKDILIGGDGQDTLFGYSGNDALRGGIDGELDYMYGGSGSDSFDTEWYFSGGWFKNRDLALDFTSGVDSFM